MHLFISDLDGTLLNRNAELSEETVIILNELIKKGLNFTAATARSPASIGQILDGLDLQLPLILMNGVLIYDPVSKGYERIHTIDPETVAEVLRLRHEMDLAPFMYTMKDNVMSTHFDRLVNESMHEFYEERVRKYRKKITQVNRLENVSDDVIYFTFLDSRERLLPLYNKLREIGSLKLAFYPDIYIDDWYMEVFSAGASKESGVKYLREKYGAEKITAFGDNLNDLPMFDAADEKIAVENAAPQLKIAADKVIGANTDDGVAKYLREVFNG
jgi:hypothetical protein